MVATRVLIVDDEPCVRELLAQFLSQEGYLCTTAEDGQSALELLRTEAFPVVISDICMPRLDGIELLQEIKRCDPLTEVIMATAVNGTEKAIEAMRSGAYDYILKPFDIHAVSTSIRRALERRQLILERKEYQERLEGTVRERTSELVEKNAQLRLLMLNTVQSLVFTLEAKDRYTEGHSRRVADMAERLARHVNIREDTVERIRLAGILHDIGKIGVREETLTKMGALTVEEYEEVKQHALLSVRILQPIEALEDILPMIKHHHERYDGTGYPDGRTGHDIPIGSRILAICDSYDAMTSDRPYRQSLSLEETFQEMRSNAGRQFDPHLVSVFLNMQDGSRHVNRPSHIRRTASTAASEHLVLFL